jgi:glycerol transport system ATP-binding protein
VRRVADLGRKRLAYVNLGGQQVVATIPREMSSIGDQARVVFDPAHTHVYVDDIRVTGAAA